MENEDWEIVHAGSDRIDLERGVGGYERKEVRRPKHITKPEWVQQFRPGMKIDENALARLLKKK
jgi:hypothetical protein